MKKVFFFGDSNTFGYDPAGFMGGRYPKESRWPEIVQENLRGLWMVTSDGMPGRAIPATKYEREYLREVLLQEMPLDVIGIMLGSNDLLGTLNPDAEKIAARMEALIDFVEGVIAEGAGRPAKPGAVKIPGFTGSEHPDILLVAPPMISLTELSFTEPYVAGGSSLAGKYQEEGWKLSRLYRELAARRKLRFADASEWELLLAHDGVHLSESGHALFAAEMVDVLRRIWNGSGHSCETCSLYHRPELGVGVRDAGELEGCELECPL